MSAVTTIMAQGAADVGAGAVLTLVLPLALLALVLAWWWWSIRREPREEPHEPDPGENG